ncbi:MAG: hypothetical protein NC124_14865 [Clostridium sp.]|nr:hypothetical protein [Clostridium sp.]
MEMCYDGALVMPSSYAVMDEEEMTYVEGGLFIKYAQVAAAIRIIGKTVSFVRKCGSVGAAVLACKKAYLTASLAFTLYWNTIPGWGQVATVIGVAVGGVMIGYAAQAVFYGTGIDISWKGVRFR